jgi:hypothetical protein
MSRSSALGVVAYEIESSWAENVATWGVRLPHVGKVDVSGLTRAKQASNRLVQYVNDGTMPVQLPFAGTFSVSLYLTGHGSSTSGATTAGEVETFLGYVLGTSASTGTGTTFTGGTASAPTTTSASGLSAGGIIFAGAIQDGGGGGQAAVISSHSSNTATLLTALPAAPTGICYSSVVMHPQEVPANAGVQSLRFRVLTTNLQYAMRGCFPASIEFTGLGPGEIPMANITFNVTHWSTRADTFPDTDTSDDFLPAANGGGSLFFNTRGTATRSTLLYRSFALTYQLGISTVKGPGGLWGEALDIVGAVRQPSQVTMEVMVDSENATTAPTHPGNWDSNTQFYHMLLTLNVASTGQRVAFYWPNICYDAEKPVQVDLNDINRVRLRFRAYTGPTTTNDLTLSVMRMAWG